VRRLEYPNYEAILVDDGSTDESAAIAREYDFQVISTENRGLSSARNTGAAAASGEIVAYLDDDAAPDPHWLHYLAATFLTTTHVGVGGPNLPFLDDGLIAEAVANAPGGPVPVLLSDREAEHLPGCNVAFRKEALAAIDGFDPQFRTAGDDVDLCWRLRERGWTLGFHPSAVVWHHRRGSLRGYWRQQVGYGRAEASLERKWPEKYNALGHLTWAGRLYGRGIARALGLGHGRLYQGTWGTASFQSLYEPGNGALGSLVTTPEWYGFVVFLAFLSGWGLSWKPLYLALPLLGLSIGLVLMQACLGASRASFTDPSRASRSHVGLCILTACLFLAQPAARLWGRLGSGLTPLRRSGESIDRVPRLRSPSVWSENWRALSDWLRSLEAELVARRVVVQRGGDFDRWDLDVRVGTLGSARLLAVVEEHGHGCQLIRFSQRPHVPVGALVAMAVFASLAAFAASSQVWDFALIMGSLAGLLAIITVRDCTAAMTVTASAVEELAKAAAPSPIPVGSVGQTA
jgi:GT2 family glycosyltransferase